MFETPNEQIMESTATPEAFDELVNAKQVSMQVIYEILVCLMIVAVIMYVTCCITLQDCFVRNTCQDPQHKKQIKKVMN